MSNIGLGSRITTKASGQITINGTAAQIDVSVSPIQLGGTTTLSLDSSLIFPGTATLKSGALTVGQITAATAGVNQNSQNLVFSGNYWTSGGASAADNWTLTDVVNTGTATITHSVLTSNVLTLTCANTFKIGNSVLINGTGHAALNGQVVVIKAGVGTWPNYTGFTANLTTANIATAADTGTCVLVTPSSTLTATHSGSPGLPLFTVPRLNTQSGLALNMTVAPVLATVTPAGTPGSTTYTYVIQAIDANGYTGPITQGSTALGNATLNGTNNNVIAWTNQSTGGGLFTPATYNIYRTTANGTPATTGLIANIAATLATFTDTGLPGDGSITSPASEQGITLYSYYQDRYNWTGFRINFDNSQFGGWTLGTSFQGNGSAQAFEIVAGGRGWFIDTANGVGSWTPSSNGGLDIGRFWNSSPPNIANISLPRWILASTAVAAAFTTIATVSTNVNSGGLQTISSFWNGAAAALDQWQLGTVLGSGSNPTSTYTLTHPSHGTGASFIDFSVAPVTLGAITTTGHMQAGPVGGSANADLAGQATVTAAATTKAVTFTNNYLSTSQPVVVLTPTSAPGTTFWVTYQGSTGAWSGFTVNLAASQAGNVTFNYQVIGQP